MLNHSSIYLAALDYAAKGCFVFPCIPNQKQPALKDWERIATTDPSKIKEWWGENAAFNLAIACGPSKLLVVDIDGQIGWEHWLTEYDWRCPSTYTVRTPRGGWHLYFRGEAPSSVRKLGPEIDTRGRGGYVLAPPSVVGVKPYSIEQGSLVVL